MKATDKIKKIRLKRRSLVRRKVWLEAYEKDLAKPQWVCLDAKIDKEMREQGAKRAADIALLYSKVGLNEPNC